VPRTAAITRTAREVYFQPIVDLDAGTVVAYEALSRGPAGPLQFPDRLFAAARERGALADLDAVCRTSALTNAVRTGGLDLRDRDPTSSSTSPFACLPAGTALRRSAKLLLVELSKHLEREVRRAWSSRRSRPAS